MMKYLDFNLKQFREQYQPYNYKYKQSKVESDHAGSEIVKLKFTGEDKYG